MSPRKASRIASFQVSRREAMAFYFPPERVYETREDEMGLVQRFAEFLRSEYGRAFDMSRMRAGKDGDDFALLYYSGGVRYKLGRDGRAFVSGADADDMFEQTEHDFQAFIDTVLLDELEKSMRGVLAADGIYVAKTKYDSSGDDGIHTRSVTGIRG